ncbi:hypothetical protein D3C71_1688250 [compost metagenome]
MHHEQQGRHREHFFAARDHDRQVHQKRQAGHADHDRPGAERRHDRPEHIAAQLADVVAPHAAPGVFDVTPRLEHQPRFKHGLAQPKQRGQCGRGLSQHQQAADAGLHPVHRQHERRHHRAEGHCGHPANPSYGSGPIDALPSVESRGHQKVAAGSDDPPPFLPAPWLGTIGRPPAEQTYMKVLMY